MRQTTINAQGLKELRQLLVDQILNRETVEPLSKDPIGPYGRVMFNMSLWFRQVDPRVRTNEGHFCNTAACALGFAAIAGIAGLSIKRGIITHEALPPNTPEAEVAMHAFNLSRGESFMLFSNNSLDNLPVTAVIRRIDDLLGQYGYVD